MATPRTAAQLFGSKKAAFCRFGAHGAGTTGTIPAVSDAGNGVGTCIYPYEPATGSASAVGARGDRRQTPHTNLLAHHPRVRLGVVG